MTGLQRRRRDFWTAGAAAGLLTLTAADARSQKPPQFGATAEVVLIDLVAIDGEGRAVSDLRANEVEVYEGGKRQRLDTLSFVGRATQTAAPAAANPDAATPASTQEGPSAASEPQRADTSPLRLVVVVDMASLASEFLVPVRSAVLSMVRETLEPDAELMLVSIDRGLQVRVPFTSDKSRFVAAVEALRPTAPGAEIAMADLVEQVERMCDGVTRNGDKSAITLARAFIEDTRQGLQNTTEGIAALSRYLAPLPGRKHMVFYSAGYAMDPQSIAASVVESMCYGGSAEGSGQQSSAPGPIRGYRDLDMQTGANPAHTALRVGTPVDGAGMLRAVLDESNRSQVSVYTVDARGLVGDSVSASQRLSQRTVRLGNAQQIQQRVARAPQEILYSIADGTGGTASINTNDMARGMNAAARDANAYYLLSYTPQGGRKDGQFYAIEVKVARPGLKIRYRRGYEWLSDQKRGERAIAAALRFPELYAQEGLAIDPWVEAGKLNVAVMLPTRILEFRNEGGQYLNDISVQALLRDAEGKMVDNRYLFAKSIGMKLPENRYAELRARDNVEVANAATAPRQGRYHLTVVARHSGGRLASASADVEIP